MNEDAVREENKRNRDRIKQQAASDKSRSDGLASAQQSLTDAEERQRQAITLSAFRQAFAKPAVRDKLGEGVDSGGQENLVGRMSSVIRQATAGAASAQVFGPQSVSMQLVKLGEVAKNTAKQADAAVAANAKLDAIASAIGGAGMVFQGGGT
jgi:hypothetical protein